MNEIFYVFQAVTKLPRTQLRKRRFSSIKSCQSDREKIRCWLMFEILKI
jgi:hypothetical protein